MSEVKITIEAPGLVEAINALAAALNGKTPCTSNIGPGTEAPAPVAPTVAVPVTPAPATAPQMPATPAIPPQMPQAPITAAPVAPGYPAAAPMATQMPAQPTTPAPSMTAPAPVAQTPAASAPSNVPTIEALSNAGAALCEKGMMPQLVGLLQKYGCQAITQLKPEYIPAFAAELRALGAAI